MYRRLVGGGLSIILDIPRGRRLRNMMRLGVFPFWRCVYVLIWYASRKTVDAARNMGNEGNRKMRKMPQIFFANKQKQVCFYTREVATLFIKISECECTSCCSHFIYARNLPEVNSFASTYRYADYSTCRKSV